jgi:hypothetical protein
LWKYHFFLNNDNNSEQLYHVWEGYLRKIPVVRRKISRADRRGKFNSSRYLTYKGKEGIFRMILAV